MKLKLLIIFLIINVWALGHTPKALQNFKKSSVWDAYSNGKSIKKGDSNFIQDCQLLSQENKNIPFKTNDIFRIATYNVHFWQDSLDNNSYINILKIIEFINADVLILQEVIFDEKLKKDLQMLGYINQKFYQTLPNLRFGNMILSQHLLLEKPLVKVFKVDTFKKEKRCFINFKIQMPNKEILSIYGTHLDVWDATENQRVQEIKELISTTQNDPTKNIIIAGDFNSVRAKDYQYKINNTTAWQLYCQQYKKYSGVDASSKALGILEDAGFKDCFEFANILAPKFTAWSGTMIDFIFLKNSWHLPINGAYAYHSSASDHLPIIMDIKSINKINSQDFYSH